MSGTSGCVCKLPLKESAYGLWRIEPDLLWLGLNLGHFLSPACSLCLVPGDSVGWAAVSLVVVNHYCKQLWIKVCMILALLVLTWRNCIYVHVHVFLYVKKKNTGFQVQFVRMDQIQCCHSSWSPNCSWTQMPLFINLKPCILQQSQ